MWSTSIASTEPERRKIRRRRWWWWRIDVSRFSSRSGDTAAGAAGGFWSADSDGKHQNLPVSLFSGSPPTPPTAHDSKKSRLLQCADETTTQFKTM